MSILTAKSVIFIEFENLLYDTDTFVIQKIYDTFKDNREHCICNELIDKIERNGIQYMKYIAQTKQNMNPIIEYLDDDIEDPAGVAEEIYNDIIYAEYGTLEPFDILHKTIIGNSVDGIMKDEHFDRMYVYCKNPTNEICDLLFELYSDRVIIIGGDKSDFFQTIPCTSYFIADALDLLDIVKVDHGDEPIEVYIPEYSFNMNKETGSILIDPPVGEIVDGTGISVNTIKLPIV